MNLDILFPLSVDVPAAPRNLKTSIIRKSKYTKYNKAYVCHSADEFYAECYYLYLFDKSWLKKQLPQTYQYIEKSLAKITPDRINRIYKTYSVIWK